MRLLRVEAIAIAQLLNCRLDSSENEGSPFLGYYLSINDAPRGEDLASLLSSLLSRGGRRSLDELIVEAIRSALAQ